MKITRTKLVKQGACERGLMVFESLYPKGFLVTRENIELAYKTALAPHMWFLGMLLEGEAGYWWNKEDNSKVGSKEEKETLILACERAGWIA